MSFKDQLRSIQDKFGQYTGYMNDEVKYARKGLHDEVAETLTELVEKAMRPMILKYIHGYFKMSTGETLHGQSAFDRLVEQDEDIIADLEKYRPSYLQYVEKARKVRSYLRWDSKRFASGMAEFLKEHGIEVTPEGYRYLERTTERFRRRIYS